MYLQQLSEAIGISGNEDAVRAIILDEIREHVDAITIDSIGNLLATKSGTGEHRLKVMIAAHMDEIGFMVKGIGGDGLIRFTNIGGINERILPGLRVRIGADQLPGIIITAPIHLSKGTAVRSLDDLRIDIGASGKEQASARVKKGDRIAFDSEFMEIGEKMLRGKAFDDRVGCSLLMDILTSERYPVDVLAAFTVQEEIGLRGATLAARKLQPDIAFALEGTTANDVLDPTGSADDLSVPNPTCKMQQGPVLTVIDSRMIVQPAMLNFLRSTAEAHQIPYQLKTAPGGGTDAGIIHLQNAGIPSAVISVPCRYIHSPRAYLHRDDYDNSLRLLQTALASAGEQLQHMALQSESLS